MSYQFINGNARWVGPGPDPALLGDFWDRASQGEMGDFWDKLGSFFSSIAHYVAKFGPIVASVCAAIPAVGPALSAGVLAATAAAKMYEKYKKGGMSGFGEYSKAQLDADLRALAWINMDRKKKGLPIFTGTMDEFPAFAKRESDKSMAKSLKSIDKLVHRYVEKRVPGLKLDVKEYFFNTNPFYMTHVPEQAPTGSGGKMLTMVSEYSLTQPNNWQRIIDRMDMWRALLGVHADAIHAMVDHALLDAEPRASFKTFYDTQHGKTVRVVNEPSIKVDLDFSKVETNLDDIREYILRQYCYTRSNVRGIKKYQDMPLGTLVHFTADVVAGRIKGKSIVATPKAPARGGLVRV